MKVPNFEKRLRGFSIDTSGAAIICILGYGVGTSLSVNVNETLGNILGYFVIFCGFFGFYFFPLLFKGGQTLGKRVEKTRIVRRDGRPCGLGRLFLREIFKVGMSILTFGIYVIINFFMISDKSPLTIHDMVFNTLVIDTNSIKEYKDDYLMQVESLQKRGL